MTVTDLVSAAGLATAREQTFDLKRRIWQRFAKSHVVLYEVPVDGQRDGRYSRQAIDAVAIGMWKSTGHIVHGMECKVTRADLKSELAHPDKHLAALTACDRFWLVVPSRDLYVGVGKQADLTPLIPADWGILVAKGNTLFVTRQAQPLRPDLSRPLNRQFVASLISSAANRIHDPAVKQLQTEMPVRAGRRRKRPGRRAA